MPAASAEAVAFARGACKGSVHGFTALEPLGAIFTFARLAVNRLQAGITQRCFDKSESFNKLSPAPLVRLTSPPRRLGQHRLLCKPDSRLFSLAGPTAERHLSSVS